MDNYVSLLQIRKPQIENFEELYIYAKTSLHAKIEQNHVIVPIDPTMARLMGELYNPTYNYLMLVDKEE